MIKRLKKIIGKHEKSSKKWFEHYNKNTAYQASEYICKSHPPAECSIEELTWIINNTMHYWNIDHCIEYNNRIKTETMLNDIMHVCRKYNINIESLAGTLEEYILNDNDGYMGYSKCDDCKYDFEIK